MTLIIGAGPSVFGGFPFLVLDSPYLERILAESSFLRRFSNNNNNGLGYITCLYNLDIMTPAEMRYYEGFNIGSDNNRNENELNISLYSLSIFISLLYTSIKYLICRQTSFF